LALAPENTDAGHPAFLRLFVETEIASKGTVIFVRRRKRMPEEAEMHIAHFVTAAPGIIHDVKARKLTAAFSSAGAAQYGGQLLLTAVQHLPAMTDAFWILSRRSGAVSISLPVKKPSFFLDNGCIFQKNLKANIACYRQPNAFTRGLSTAWTHSRIISYQIGMQPQEVTDYQKYASYLICPERVCSSAEMIVRNLGSQSDLWPMSISGDYPVFVLRFQQWK